MAPLGWAQFNYEMLTHYYTDGQLERFTSVGDFGELLNPQSGWYINNKPYDCQVTVLTEEEKVELLLTI